MSCHVFTHGRGFYCSAANFRLCRRFSRRRRCFCRRYGLGGIRHYASIHANTRRPFSRQMGTQTGHGDGAFTVRHRRFLRGGGPNGRSIDSGASFARRGRRGFGRFGLAGGCQPRGAQDKGDGRFWFGHRPCFYDFHIYGNPFGRCGGDKRRFCAHRLCRPLGVCHYPFDAVAGALRRHRRFFLDFTKNHWRRLKVFALGAFALHYALATIFLYLPTALNLALEQHWRVYAPSFLASLLIAVPLIYFADRRPATIMLIACALIPPGLFIIFTFGHWSQWATVGLFLFFSGFIVLEAAIPARVSHAALANRRGLSLGVVMTCQFAGIFAGGAFSGLLIDMFGGPTAAAVAGLLFLGWFAVLLRIGKHISAAN